MTEEKITMGAQKRIALIAHDHLKDDLVKWCMKNKDVLKRHFLCGTGTTSKLIAESTGLPVKAFKSGPLGGDQQVGARIAEGEIDMVIFFSDPLEAQPHDPDIKALLRIANVYDIPFANNRATADFLMKSEYMNASYEHNISDYKRMTEKRVESIYKEIQGD
ncbi:MAG: methylglyoxal synthase [Eubacteriaceae bacterium]|nr:methylglyoxal synthase [Eubacteriaceae bacterium]